jgi:hypothetical protein
MATIQVKDVPMKYVLKLSSFAICHDPAIPLPAPRVCACDHEQAVPQALPQAVLESDGLYQRKQQSIDLSDDNE